jgi:hypothetical protein
MKQLNHKYPTPLKVCFECKIDCNFYILYLRFPVQLLSSQLFKYRSKYNSTYIYNRPPYASTVIASVNCSLCEWYRASTYINFSRLPLTSRIIYEQKIQEQLANCHVFKRKRHFCKCSKNLKSRALGLYTGSLLVHFLYKKRALANRLCSFITRGMLDFEVKCSRRD